MNKRLTVKIFSPFLWYWAICPVISTTIPFVIDLAGSSRPTRNYLRDFLPMWPNCVNKRHQGLLLCLRPFLRHFWLKIHRPTPTRLTSLLCTIRNLLGDLGPSLFLRCQEIPGADLRIDSNYSCWATRSQAFYPSHSCHLFCVGRRHSAGLFPNIGSVATSAHDLIFTFLPGYLLTFQNTR